MYIHDKSNKMEHCEFHNHQPLPLLTRHFGIYGEKITLPTIVLETKETIRSTVKALKSQLDLLTKNKIGELRNIEIGLFNNLRRITWINNRIETFKTMSCCESETNELLDSSIYNEYLSLYPLFETECNEYFTKRLSNVPRLIRSGTV